MQIHAWGFVYDGGTILQYYPQGEDAPWNKQEIAVPKVERQALYLDIERLALDRLADTPTLDRLAAAFV